jgi:hypothetical protein
MLELVGVQGFLVAPRQRAVRGVDGDEAVIACVSVEPVVEINLKK